MFFRTARIIPTVLFFVYCIPTSDRVNNTPERDNAKMEDQMHLLWDLPVLFTYDFGEKEKYRVDSYYQKILGL